VIEVAFGVRQTWCALVVAGWRCNGFSHRQRYFEWDVIERVKKAKTRLLASLCSYLRKRYRDGA